MSFDLMVFEPGAAPTSSAQEFLAWYDEQTEWSEDHGYDDPAVCSESLRAWLSEIVTDFPVMNGPDAAEVDVDDPRLSDYCIGKNLIYVGFAWSLAEAAHERVSVLARKHKLGFFDITADTGGVWLPAKNDGYEMVLTADDLGAEEEEGYGLFIFDPEKAPDEQETFIDWCIQLQEKFEEQSDGDPDIELDPKLQALFMDITTTFPFLYTFDDAETNPEVTDYALFGPAIFALFPEARADQAYETVLRLAKAHKLGVHDISSDGDVWRPTADGGYEVAFQVKTSTE